MMVVSKPASESSAASFDAARPNDLDERMSAQQPGHHLNVAALDRHQPSTKRLDDVEAAIAQSAPSQVKQLQPSTPSRTKNSNIVSESAVSGPVCNLRTRGLSQFPPRLARNSRPSHHLQAQVTLPTLPPLASPQLNNPVSIASRTELTPQVTLTMRPARLPVSGLWYRLRFSSVLPLAKPRRSHRWRPGKPRRGRPEGTKGAGSRSL